MGRVLQPHQFDRCALGLLGLVPVDGFLRLLAGVDPSVARRGIACWLIEPQSFKSLIAASYALKAATSGINGS